MGLADGNNYSGGNEGNNNNKLYDNTYYSRFSIKNQDRQLSIQYRAGLMILEINDVDQTTFKRTSLGNIFLSPMKSQMLVNEINRFKEYRNNTEAKKIDEGAAFGVTGGMKEKVSYIGFHTNKDRDIFLTIGKFDESGKIVESNSMMFNKDYNYSIEWEDINSMKLERVFDNDIELNMLQTAIAEFARNINGAAGYAAADLTRFDNARILRKMDPIYDKLGIERRLRNRQQYSNNDFLSNTSAISKPTTIEEVTDLLTDYE